MGLIQTQRSALMNKGSMQQLFHEVQTICVKDKIRRQEQRRREEKQRGERLLW